MRKLFTSTIMLLSVTGLLNRCTVDADRIYTVCRQTETETIVYDGSGVFYTYTGDSFYKNMDPTLTALPCLCFVPSDGVFNITNQLPGLYNGTLKSLEHYVYKITGGDNSKVNVTYKDPYMLEMYVDTSIDNYRIIYNIRGEIRIYSASFSNPLYLNE